MGLGCFAIALNISEVYRRSRPVKYIAGRLLLIDGWHICMPFLWFRPDILTLWCFKLGIRERRERERVRRRRDIQDAAKQLFMEKGYKATSIEDIAQAAELGTATIYQYFSGKEELYVSLNLITLRFLVDELNKIHTNASLASDKKINLVVQALYNTFLHDPLALQIIFHVQLHDSFQSISDDLMEQLNEVGKEGLSLMAAIYEQGVREGFFEPDPGMVHADIMWSIFAGLVLWEEAKKRFDSNKDFLQPTLFRAFEIYCRGIRKSA